MSSIWCKRKVNGVYFFNRDSEADKREAFCKKLFFFFFLIRRLIIIVRPFFFFFFFQVSLRESNIKKVLKKMFELGIIIITWAYSV